MQIGITNPLREFLKWKAFAPWKTVEDPLFCWDAHRVKVDGRVMLVVCNAANRFTAVTAVRAAGWKRLGKTCEQAIEAAMLSAGFSHSAVQTYFELAGEVEFGRTHGRVAVACMNRMVDTLLWCRCERGVQFQRRLCHAVNEDDIGSCACHDGYGKAAERMADDLVSHGINPFQECDNATCGEGPSIPNAAAGCFGPDYSILPEHLADYAAVAASRERAAEGEAELAEIDARLASAADDEEARYREGEEAIRRAKRAMLEDRGLAGGSPGVDECCICGAGVRVRLGNEPYCLNCLNELVERMHGLPHPSNDASTIAVFAPDGETIQFAVERLVTPLGAQWSAHEIVEAGDPRLVDGYDGVEVHVFTDPRADQDDAFAELWEKAQQAVSNPSTHVPDWPGGRFSNGAHIGGEARFANDVGWGRIEDVPDYCIIIDGQRYTGEQFLRLLSGCVGFNLQWRIVDRTDPLPDMGDMANGD